MQDDILGISSLMGVIVKTCCALQRNTHSNGLKSSREQCRKYRAKPVECLLHIQKHSRDWLKKRQQNQFHTMEKNYALFVPSNSCSFS